MQVEYRLAAVPIGVDDHSIAVRRKSLFAGYFRGHEHHVTHHRLVAFLRLVQGIEVDLGDDQDVRRGLRADVVEGEAMLVLVHL